MATVFFLNKSPYPRLIRFLRLGIFGCTLLFAILYELFAAHHISFSPTVLLLSHTASWSTLWQPFTSMLTIPYQGLSLSTFFDLFLVNVFLTPITSFVFSFLNTRSFILFLLQMTFVGTCTFFGASLIFSDTLPCSSFPGLALAIVVFWALLHSKGQPSYILAIPISRFWIVFIAVLTVLLSPLFAGEWAKVTMILSMSVSAYLWGIGRWRLRSHIANLAGFEHVIDQIYRYASRIMQWYVLRPFRLFRR